MIKLIQNIRRSLTTKICLLTCLLLICACVLTYGLIIWMMPITYTADLNQALALETEDLIRQLSSSSLEDCEDLLIRFAAEQNAHISITDTAGNQLLNIQSVRESAPADEDNNGAMQAISSTFSFSASSEDVYQLTVVGSAEAINQAAEALGRIWPWLTAIILVISALSSILYASMITRPIVGISRISRKMSGLDFSWRCDERRKDEIGALAASLNRLSDKLSAAMEELKTANRQLQEDFSRARELEQQRLRFFSAASHELKTPITIVKGQLTGMLDGIGVYADRDRYLARSLAVMSQMEGLVQELLAVSRLETAGRESKTEPLSFSALIRDCLNAYDDLFCQRNLRLMTTDTTEPLWVSGNRSQLEKAVRNILSNAAFYSPEGGEIRVAVSAGAAVGFHGEQALLTVENTGVRIPEEALPHLFEDFYRADTSRNRQSGGSGLGLYLVKMILDRHKGSCQITNTGEGVMVQIQLPLCSAPGPLPQHSKIPSS